MKRDIFLNAWQRDVFTGKQFLLSKQNLSDCNNAKGSQPNLKMIDCDKILEEGKNIFNLEQFTLVQKFHGPGKKNIIKSIKFIIYNRYIEEQFYPWFKFSFTSSESPKIVTNRQTLQQSNSLSRETDSEPKYIKYEPKLISTIFLDRFTSSYSKILVRTITRLIRDHFGGDVQKGHACHAHSLSRFSFLSTTTIILFSVQVKSYPSTLDKVIQQEYLTKFDLSKSCTRKHLTIEITIAVNCLTAGDSCKTP